MFRLFASRAGNAHTASRRHARSRHKLRPFLNWEGSLETRTLLSITWTNRGVTDNFGVFGASAATARNVVDQAVAYWNSYLNVSTAFSLEVIITADIGNGAATSITGFDFVGGRWRPNAATISVDSGTDGMGGRYFFDPTPADNSEFSDVFAPYVLDANTSSPVWDSVNMQFRGDFLALIVHEMAHGLGYTQRFLSRDGETFPDFGGIGYDNPFTTDTGQGYSDPTAMPPSATYWVYDSPTVDTVLTNFNSGGGGTAFHGPVHAAENTGAGRTISFGGKSYFTSIDLMNPFYSWGRRNLITYNTLNIINESVAWGLGATPLANALINLDPMGNLFVSGDSTDNLITITTTSAGQVDVVVTTQIMGVHPNNMITASFPAGLVLSVNVDAELGNDTVDLSKYIAITNPPPIIIGNDGNDLIYGSPMGDDISGNDGIDTIYGGDGDDTIAGGDNNDFLYGGLGSNTITDGDGNDLVDFSQNAMRVIFSTSGGNDTVIGTQFDDILTGSDGNDRLEGRKGNDILFGGAGEDSLVGGDGSDSFSWRAGDGNDLVEGGTGENDLIFNGDITAGVDNSFSIMRNGTRVDVQLSGGGSVSAADVQYLRVYAGQGSDTFNVADLTGTSVRVVDLNYSLIGGNQAVLDGTNLADDVNVAPHPIVGSIVQVTGLSALVHIHNAKLNNPAGLDRVSIRGLGGNDTLKSTSPVETRIAVTLDGGIGNDVLSADATLLGGSGDDTFIVPLGTNVIDGGTGNDIILIEGTEAYDEIEVVQTDLGGGVAGVNIDVNGNTSTNDVENVELIKINALGGADFIRIGGAGTLIPFAVYGGFDNDLISGHGVAMNVAAARIAAFGEQGRDTIQGGSNRDSLFGGDDADLFYWQSGDNNDVFDGTGETDALVVIATETNDCFAIAPADALATQVRINVDAAGGPLGDGSLLAADIEHVSLQGAQGDDLFLVKPLHTTPVVLLDLDFGIGGGNDIAVLQLSNGGNNITVSSSDTNADVDVNGLSEVIRIYNTSTDDYLRVQGGEAADVVNVTPAVLAKLSVIVDGGDGPDSISGAPTAIGGPGDDSIIGTPGPDVLLGDLGNDTIRGLQGDDLILGDASATGAGAGLDCDSGMGGIPAFAINPYVPGGGEDLLFGDDGDDSINGGDGDDTIEGGYGDDLLGRLPMTAHPLLPSLFPDWADDLILGGPGLDNINGDGDDDTLSGGASPDTVHGGLGDDLIFGDESDDLLCGGPDMADGIDPTLDGNDTLFGGAGNDAVFGQYGDDSLNGGEGNDYLWGQQGDDRLGYLEYEGAIYFDPGNDYMVGGDGDDFISGALVDASGAVVPDGNDVMFGQAGNDTLWGGAGGDMLYGGIGDDVLLGGSPLTANVAHSIRNPHLPGDGNDTILGGDGFDIVDGGNNNNLMDAGDDNIRETILGGTGNDMAFNHLATDPVNYDLFALNGGFNHKFHNGFLIEPPVPDVDCAFVDWTIPAQYFTGYKVRHDGTVVEVPPLSVRTNPEYGPNGPVKHSRPARPVKPAKPARPTVAIPAARTSAAATLRDRFAIRKQLLA